MREILNHLEKILLNLMGVQNSLCKRGAKQVLRSEPRLLVFALALLLVCPTAGFTDKDLQISGYYKNFFTVFNSPEPRASDSMSSEPIIGAASNRLRLNLFYKPSRQISFSAAYDFSPRVQDPSLFNRQLVLTAINPSKYRVADLDSQVYPTENDPVGSFGIFQNLDRALITLSASLADIYIGRQAIAWGSAHVLNPTDVIAPFTYNELDTEDRIGVDAVRVRIPIGTLGELDSGYVFGEDFDFEKSAFFLRNRFNVTKTDVTILLLGFQENLLVGFDMTRAIGGAGFWFEGAYVFVNAFDNDETNGGTNYFRGSIGLDYSFSGRTYGFIEYHFSQAGAKKPKDYLTNLTQPAYTQGAVYLMGRHYLAPGLTYQITPLISFGGQTLFNLSDGSMFISPQVEYNIAQDIYVSAGAFVGIGKRPETVAGDNEDSTQQFRSEFGGYPNIYFTSFRIYF